MGAVQAAEGDEFMMITNAGTLVRTRVAEVSQVGRNTQGVTLIRTSEEEQVVALQRIEEVEETEEELVEGESEVVETKDIVEENKDNDATSESDEGEQE